MQTPPTAGLPATTTAAASVRPLMLPGPWPSATAEELERERLLGPTRASDAGRQFARCFARWPGALDHIRLAALRALAANRPVDPNDPDVWRSRDEHAQAILRRHGLTQLSAGRLTLAAIGELIAGQARRTATPALTGARSPSRRPASTSRCAARTQGWRSRSMTRRSTRTASTSATHCRGRSASRPSRPTTCRAGC